MTGRRKSESDRRAAVLAALLCALCVSAVNTSAQCEVPAGLTISAPDPCRVVNELRQELREYKARRWFHRWTRDLPTQDGIELEDLGLWRVVEMAEPYPCGQYTCLGSFNAFLGELIFVRRYDQSHRVIFHELGHATELANGSLDDMRNVGHGTPLDPFVIALNAWVRWTYMIPLAHSYHPGFLPAPRIAAAAIMTEHKCEVRLEGK